MLECFANISLDITYASSVIDSFFSWKRLANKSPHALTKNVVHNPDKGFSPDDTPDFGSLNLNFL